MPFLNRLVVASTTPLKRRNSLQDNNSTTQKEQLQRKKDSLFYLHYPLRYIAPELASSSSILSQQQSRPNKSAASSGAKFKCKRVKAAREFGVGSGNSTSSEFLSGPFIAYEEKVQKPETVLSSLRSNRRIAHIFKSKGVFHKKYFLSF